MEVTRHNFKGNLAEVSKAISEADFLAIDGEFTGLGATTCQIHAFDTPESRYQKLRKGAMDMLLIQFGLCAFHYDKDKQKHICKAFNFYVFPRPFSRQAPDPRFLCQTSSFEFLISQGFDFNKWIKDGISYLTLEDEQRLREALQHKHEQLSSQMTSPSFTSPHGDLMKGPVIIPEEQKSFIDGICEKIEEFLKSDDEQCIEIPPCNGFQRKLIYQTVSTKYKNNVHVETKTDKNNMRYLVVSRVDGIDDFKTREQNKRQAEVEELDDAVGFSKVIKLMTESRKLVIGHNMMLDLLHVISHFRCKLPEDYEEFKALSNCVFPHIIDTKLMANSYPFKEMIINTGLGSLQKILEENPFVKPQIVTPDDFPSYSTNSERLHEAGYDAYITGICFIGMGQHLGTYKKEQQGHLLPSSPLLKPFLNKIFLMRINDIPYMNLTEPDLQPDRSHVFHITFPKAWRTSDIAQLFSPFGSVYVGWLDDTSAFVSLNAKASADTVRQHIQPSELYKVMPYEEFMRKEEIAQHHGTPQLKRKMPSSDISIERPKRKRSSEYGSEDQMEEAAEFATHASAHFTWGSPFSGASKIPPIIEEDEMEADEESTKSDKKSRNGAKIPLDDSGIPTKRAKVSGNSKKEEEMFEVPSTW